MAWCCVAILWLVAAYLGAHQSEQPTVLGRYSPSYALMLAIIAVLAVALTIVCAKGWHHRFAGTASAIALTAISTFVTLGVAEVLVRILDPIGISYYAETRRYELDKQADDRDLIYRHRPSYEERYQGVDVRINELGLRDDPIQDKQPGEYRVLLLGDSVAFGWGVAQEQIFAARLEQFLGERLARPVVVINGGVGSYNTGQEYAWMSRVAKRLSPDAVMLLYVTNDIETHEYPFDPASDLVSLRGKSPPEVTRMLVGRLWTYRLASHIYTYGSVLRTSPGGDVAALRGSPGWARSMDAAGKVSELAKELGVPSTIFLFSWTHTPFEEALIKDLESTVGAPVTETSPWFAGLDLVRYRNSIVDSHPNAAGHELLARHMADVLREVGSGDRAGDAR
jgi:lysophospholipase L1-like esterase